MGIFDKFSGSDLAVLITGLAGAAVAAIAAWRQHRKGGRADAPASAAEPIVRLHHEDRSLIAAIRDVAGSLRDAMLTNGRRIDSHTDALTEHRRTIEDHAALIRRKREE